MRTGIVLILAAAALSAVGPPNADEVTIEIDQRFLIPILANDPTGTLLLGVNLHHPGSTTGDTPITYGQVQMRGNEILYTPLAGFEGTDEFTYTTNGGTTTVTMIIVPDLNDGGGGGGGGVDTFPVQLVNNVDRSVRFLVLSNNGTFYRDCTPTSNPDDPEGTVDVPGMTTEPMGIEELCVEVTDTNDSNTLVFQAISGNFISTVELADVNPAVNDLVQVIATPIINTETGVLIGIDIDTVVDP